MKDRSTDHPRTPPALERRDVHLGAVTLSHGRAGAGSPLVLIHGLGGSSRWWAKNIGPLAERFEVHVVDLVGFGESRNRQRFALAEAASQLASLLDQLGIGRAAIVGHSMGGYIAAQLAAEFPERVSRLVLVDAAMLPAGFVSARQLLNLMLAAPRLPARFIPTIASDVRRAGPGRRPCCARRGSSSPPISGRSWSESRPRRSSSGVIATG